MRIVYGLFASVSLFCMAYGIMHNFDTNNLIVLGFTGVIAAIFENTASKKG
jgi:hypothetical protein